MRELVERNLAGIEAALNEKTPPAEKAFNRVLAVVEAMQAAGLYSFAVDRAKENLAITASEEGLSLIGREYGILRVEPKAWQGEAHFNATDGMVIPLGTIFVSSRGFTYRTRESVTSPQGSPGSGVLLLLDCTEPGSGGNLSAGDTLTAQTPIEGAPEAAEVTDTSRLGTEEEGIEDWRRRILDAEQSEGGGCNSADLRSWAQTVAGVRRAYPFSEPPIGSGLIPAPGYRTVYIEAAPDIEPDGITPQSLLDLVREALLSDSESGISREPLGLPGEMLYTASIIRTGIYLTAVGVSITTGTMGGAQATITEALDKTLRSFSPYVQGLDPEFVRRDKLAASYLASEAQNILDSYGGAMENILFGLSPGENLGHYTLAHNETLRLAGITFMEAAGA
jgi:hypothetical protein